MSSEVMLSKQELEYRQRMFEDIVSTGFEPLKQFIEARRLEEDLSPSDIHKIMENVENNVLRWCEWLRFQKRNRY